MRQFFENKWARVSYVSAVLLSICCCSLGAINGGVPGETNMPGPINQPLNNCLSKRWMSDTGNSVRGYKWGLVCQNACEFYSLAASIKMALYPEELFLVVEDKEVADYSKQYAFVLRQCLPVMEAIIAPSFKLDLDFLLKTRDIMRDFDGNEKEQSTRFAEGNLNEDFLDILEKNESLREEFQELVELFYNEKCSSKEEYDALKVCKNGFLSLRETFFTLWIDLVIGEPEADKDEENDVEENELIRRYCERRFQGKSCDIRSQKEIILNEIEKFENCATGVPHAGDFLLGRLKVWPHKDSKIYERFTLNMFRSNGCVSGEGFKDRYVYLEKSFFSTLCCDKYGVKPTINIVSYPCLSSIWKNVPLSWHAVPLTPDERYRWITFNLMPTEVLKNELAKDKRGWRIFRKLSRKARKQKESAVSLVINRGFDHFKSEVEHKRPIITAVTHVPIPVSIREKGDNSVKDDDRKSFGYDDFPDRFKNIRPWRSEPPSQYFSFYHSLDKQIQIQTIEKYPLLLQKTMKREGQK